MTPSDFHNKPFDEATLTKLRLVELYAKEWCPVFLSQENPRIDEIHLFDFFAGSGRDSEGQFGSPLRLLNTLNSYRDLAGWNNVKKHLHFFDASASKISALRQNIAKSGLDTTDLEIQIDVKKFADAFAECSAILDKPKVAKLVFIDQFGIKHMTSERYVRLSQFPICDFMFFVSSEILNRFADHPSIQNKIQIERPHDSYHIHRKVKQYYEHLIDPKAEFYLSSFSLRKPNGNIYGLIFGSQHILGALKFVTACWKEDNFRGEANFDIDRENLKKGHGFLFSGSKKLDAFEEDLSSKLISGELVNERSVLTLCLSHGVLGKHAMPVMKQLREKGIIDYKFKSPIDRIPPRPVALLKKT